MCYHDTRLAAAVLIQQWDEVLRFLDYPPMEVQVFESQIKDAITYAMSKAVEGFCPVKLEWFNPGCLDADWGKILELYRLKREESLSIVFPITN